MQLISIADLQRPDEQLEPLLQHAKGLFELWQEFIKQDDESYSYDVTDHGEKSRSPGIHASEMSACMLKMVYSIMGLERRVSAQSADANMKLRFRTGTAIHAMLQTDFTRMAAWYTSRYAHLGLALHFQSELRISPELQQVANHWGLSSSCDGCFTFSRWDEATNGWVPFLRVGVEIKTSSDAQFADRKRPETYHLEQTCLYQACLDIPVMWLLYYNKSNSNVTTPYSPWLFKFDENLWKRELETRFAKAHQHVATREMPARTEGMHCKWCAFNYYCKPSILEKQAAYNAPISAGMLVRR